MDAGYAAAARAGYRPPVDPGYLAAMRAGHPSGPHQMRAGSSGIGFRRPKGITVPTDGPSVVYIPSTTTHWTSLGLPAPSHQWFGGTLNLTIGSESCFANGTLPTQNNAVTSWTTLFAGLTDGNTACSWRNTNNPLVPGSGVSYAMLAYVSINSCGANGRKLFTLASTGFQTRVNTSGTLNNFVSAGVTGGVNHLGATVRPYIYYRNAANSTAGIMTGLENISNSYVSGAFTTLSTHGFGADNSSASVGALCCLMAFWIGTNAATIAAKSTLTTLGWSIPW